MNDPILSNKAWEIVSHCPDGQSSCKGCSYLDKCEHGKTVVAQMISRDEFYRMVSKNG